MANLLIISENLKDIKHWQEVLDISYKLCCVSSVNEINYGNQYDLVILCQALISQCTQVSKLSKHLGKVLVIGNDWEGQEQIDVIKQGARGYSDFSIDPYVLQKAVESILNEEIWMQRQLVPELVRQLALNSTQKSKLNLKLISDENDIKLSCLSKRELEVAELIYQGKQVHEIAFILKIKERTVKAHISSIFNKLQVKDRYQLMVFLKDHHLERLSMVEN